MTSYFTRALAALSLGAMALTGIAATPALAQQGRDAREYRRDVRDAQRDYRRDSQQAQRRYAQDQRRAQRDYRQDVRDARRDWRSDRRDYRRPGRVVYAYDYSRRDNSGRADNSGHSADRACLLYTSPSPRDS